MTSVPKPGHMIFRRPEPIAQEMVDNALLPVDPVADAMADSYRGVVTVRVMPALAQKWLDESTANFVNRALRPREVEKLTRQYTEGRFSKAVGGQLRFDHRGILVDGQHRLVALVQSGVTQEFDCFYGLTAEEVHDLDTGLRRQFSDLLKMGGYTYTKEVSGIVTGCMAWENGARGKNMFRVEATNAEKMAWFEKHADEVMRAHERSYDARTVASTPAVRGTALWLIDRVDQADAQSFATALASGAGLPVGHPVLVLRETLARTRVPGATTRPGWLVLAWWIKAWNAYREDRSVSMLVYRPKGGEPYPEPK